MPAPRWRSSWMLPVSIQTCTLATGALRSSWTMMPRPFGSVEVVAVTAGKVRAAAESAAGVEWGCIMGKVAAPWMSGAVGVAGA